MLLLIYACYITTFLLHEVQYVSVILMIAFTYINLLYAIAFPTVFSSLWQVEAKSWDSSPVHYERWLKEVEWGEWKLLFYTYLHIDIPTMNEVWSCVAYPVWRGSHSSVDFFTDSSKGERQMNTSHALWFS